MSHPIISLNPAVITFDSGKKRNKADDEKMAETDSFDLEKRQ